MWYLKEQKRYLVCVCYIIKVRNLSMNHRLIIGPTCSGKSALADTNATVIINADSQQVYKSLSLLRATPAVNPRNYLYSILDDDQTINAAEWAVKAAEIINQNSEVTVVGGTALYVQVLIAGLPPAPAVPSQVAAQVLEIANLEEFVLSVDPSFRFRDPHRLQRAAGVYLATGHPITYWQTQPRTKLIDCKWDITYTDKPTREHVISRIHNMIKCGAISQVQENPTPPRVVPIGFEPIKAYLDDQISYQQMIETWANHTMQYAKRQKTFFDKLISTIS